jgi:hypothetical protein
MSEETNKKPPRGKREKFVPDFNRYHNNTAFLMGNFMNKKGKGGRPILKGYGRVMGEDVEIVVFGANTKGQYYTKVMLYEDAEEERRMLKERKKAENNEEKNNPHKNEWED